MTCVHLPPGGFACAVHPRACATSLWSLSMCIVHMLGVQGGSAQSCKCHCSAGHVMHMWLP